MHQAGSWVEGFPAAVTVTDAKGIIVEMNQHAAETFARDGGRELVGSDVLDCHPEPARTLTARLYQDRQPNHYTIEKNGQWKIIHQMPWFKDGEFAGVVEISIPIPSELPHHRRDPA